MKKNKCLAVNNFTLMNSMGAKRFLTLSTTGLMKNSLTNYAENV